MLFKNSLHPWCVVVWVCNNAAMKTTFFELGVIFQFCELADKSYPGMCLPATSQETMRKLYLSTGKLIILESLYSYTTLLKFIAIFSKLECYEQRRITLYRAICLK